MSLTPSYARCEFSEQATESPGRGAAVAEYVEALLERIAQQSPISTADSSPPAASPDWVERELDATAPAPTVAISPAEPSKDMKIRSAILKSKQASLRRRAS